MQVFWSWHVNVYGSCAYHVLYAYDSSWWSGFFAGHDFWNRRRWAGLAGDWFLLPSRDRKEVSEPATRFPQSLVPAPLFFFSVAICLNDFVRLNPCSRVVVGLAFACFHCASCMVVGRCSCGIRGTSRTRLGRRSFHGLYFESYFFAYVS